MLSNLVIGSEKLVLFIDHTTYEPISSKLIEKLLGRTAICHLPRNVDTSFTQAKTNIGIDREITTEKSNVILDVISKLECGISVAEIIKLVHNIKRSSKTKQLFVWCSVKNVADKKLIPFLTYMADIIVTFKNQHHLSVLIKRNTGSVSKKEYRYQIDRRFEISIKEKSKISNDVQTLDPESLATFKINVDEDEQIARNALKLPYEKTSDDQQKSSQIYYQPDSDDDFDDEDPDEDLNI